jgi:hypothetical protein
MVRKRYLQPLVTRDLEKKMVFVAGPRQVGKTTMAQMIGDAEYGNYSYLNWDNREDRKAILEGEYRSEAKLVIFDEIHKYKKWKNYVKGEFDKYKQKFHILVTGSARLDLYRMGGDSLMGRYHYFRLHPFSVAEALETDFNSKTGDELQFDKKIEQRRLIKFFDDLFKFGGFPEPFLSKNFRTLRRFHNQRLDRLIKEDIRDVELVRDLSALQILVEILPDKVGAPLSLNSLREDLEVNYKTIKLWMDILERFYYHFRIYPYSARTIKSLRKEAKMYLWDWSQIKNEDIKFENMVASHLLKLVHYLYDSEGYKTELFYLRDVAGREVDFLMTVDKKPWMVIEVKMTKQQISTQLRYFIDRLKVPFAYQVVKETGVDFWKERIRIMSADKFLSGLV